MISKKNLFYTWNKLTIKLRTSTRLFSLFGL